jgi:hypothetical protein
MLTSKIECRVEEFLIGPRLLSPATFVGGSERCRVASAKPADQVADGAWPQRQGVGNFRNGLTTLPTSEQHQTNRNRHDPSHTLVERKQAMPKPSAYSSAYRVGGRAAAPQNQVSELAAKPAVR